MLSLPEIVSEEWLKNEGFKKIEFIKSKRVYYALQGVVYKLHDDGKYYLHIHKTEAHDKES